MQIKQEHEQERWQSERENTNCWQIQTEM